MKNTEKKVYRTRFSTTFEPSFIKKMKFEALKRDMPVSRLIEKAIEEYLKEDNNA